VAAEAHTQPGAQPSIATYARLGIVLVPLTLVGTVAVSSWI
jgi:hypothetical protein